MAEPRKSLFDVSGGRAFSGAVDAGSSLGMVSVLSLLYFCFALSPCRSIARFFSLLTKEICDEKVDSILEEGC